MKSAQLILLLFLVPLIVGLVLLSGCGNDDSTALQIIQDVTPTQAFDLIEHNRDNPDFVIIDVRTPEEFSEERIENAINLDYYSETFRDSFDDLDKDKKYLIYCRSGRRGGETLDIMRELGFKEVYHISGGIIRWKEAELPTISQASSSNAVAAILVSGHFLSTA